MRNEGDISLTRPPLTRGTGAPYRTCPETGAVDVLLLWTLPCNSSVRRGWLFSAMEESTQLPCSRLRARHSTQVVNPLGMAFPCQDAASERRSRSCISLSSSEVPVTGSPARVARSTTSKRGCGYPSGWDPESVVIPERRPSGTAEASSGPDVPSRRRADRQLGGAPRGRGS